MKEQDFIGTLQQIKAIVDTALHDVKSNKGSRRTARTSKTLETPKPADISFNMNVLAFMNTHARGLKGPHKFTLLLAHTVKGKTTQQEPRAKLEKQWNKMKGVLGGKFNPAHANRAKAKGWVDSPKHGVYTLSESWKGCIKN